MFHVHFRLSDTNITRVLTRSKTTKNILPIYTVVPGIHTNLYEL